MSSGRRSFHVHREDIDDDDFRPHAPARDQSLRTPTSSAKNTSDNPPHEKEDVKDIDMEMKEVVALHHAPAFYPGAVATVDTAKFDEKTKCDNAKRTLTTDVDDTFDMNSIWQDFDMTSSWQDDKETPTQRPTRSEYPANIDWSEQEELNCSAQSSADMAHEARTQRESRVGAVHIPRETTAGAAESQHDDAFTVVSAPPEAIVAEAVARDSLAMEIRNDLLYELREEMQRHGVVAAVQPYSPDPAEPPFWTKGRSRAALLLLLFIVTVGVVIGALAAAGIFEGGNGEESSESFDSNGSVLFADKFSGREELDRFGSVVVISRDGKTMAVGAEEGNYVRVFRLVGKNWKLRGEPKTIEGYKQGRPIWKMRRFEPGWVSFGGRGME
jgi:hypothetical protein